MFFVFFSIDLVLLDSKKRIVAIKKNFLPFTVYAPNVAFRYAIEAEKGVVENHRLSLGTKLFFSQQNL